MLVDVHVSSMNTSFSTSIVGSACRHALRARCTSSRSCSLACRHDLSFDFQLSTLQPLFRVGKSSCELIERQVAAGWGRGFEQGFDAAHGFGGEQDIAANEAHLGGNVVDYHHLNLVFDGVDDR